MIRKIHLHGWLKEEFGTGYVFDVDNPAEALRAMQANFPKFFSAIKDGEFHVVAGELEPGNDIAALELNMGFKQSDLHIVPAIAGGKGWVQILTGVVMIAAAAVTVFFAPELLPMMIPVFLGGAMSVVGGIIQMLTPVPQPPTPEIRQASNPGMMGAGTGGSLADNSSGTGGDSFLFDGAINVSRQGVCVPVVYGYFGCGSVVISSGLKNERIPVAA